MKGLRKYLTPFAPDQSGAVSMCYALGGMVVIVDAGGCAGNVCGFDEPRWQPDYYGHPSDEASIPRVGAVFSAGLRDMDAILGRDDLLVKKLRDASKKKDVKFIALIGTPVPAVIGTDLASIAAMTERSVHLPCVAVSTDGMHMYDRGIEEALLVLMKAFALNKEELPEHSGEKVCGVLGLNPLDLFDPAWMEAIKKSLNDNGYGRVLMHGMEGGIGTLQMSGLADINYVVSPAGIAAAEYLRERFNTPYVVAFPADPMILLEEDVHPYIQSLTEDSKVLVVHQQVIANSVRDALRRSGVKCPVTAATWFELKDSLAEEGDTALREEDDFISLVERYRWDLIIADPTLRPMAKGFGGKWTDAFHFAVSGQAAIDRSRRRSGKEQ